MENKLESSSDVIYFFRMLHYAVELPVSGHGSREPTPIQLPDGWSTNSVIYVLRWMVSAKVFLIVLGLATVS